MAGDPFKLAQAGQDLDIPAAAWNAVIGLVRGAAGSQRGQRPGDAAGGLDGCECLAHNTSGVDLDQFGVLGVSGPFSDPADAPDAFAQRPALTCVKPAAEHVDGKFVVVGNPLANGAVGVAAAAGVTVCRIDVTVEAHGYAKAAVDNTAALVSADAGPCVVLWKQAGTGTSKWAVVRFGGGSAPGVKWGKLMALWVPGNSYVTLQPVTNAAGIAFPTPPATVNVSIIMPLNTVPAYLHGEINAVFAYEDLGSGVYLLKSPQTTPIPVNQWEVIQNQSVTTSAPRWAAGFMEAHGIP